MLSRRYPPGTESLRETTPWGDLVLQIRHGPVPGAALILGGNFLMDSESADSERALARRGLEVLRIARATRPSGLRLLVGGLGLGITLREVLDLPGVAFVQVVEILAAVVNWNRSALTFLNDRALQDPRVACWVGDLREFLMKSGVPAGVAGDVAHQDLFDLLLLDVDNGPTWLALPSNQWLYTRDGLETLRARIASRGVAVFWATEPAPAFEEQLSEVSWGRWFRESVPTPMRPGEPPIDCFLYFLERRE